MLATRMSISTANEDRRSWGPGEEQVWLWSRGGFARCGSRGTHETFCKALGAIGWQQVASP